MNHYTSYRYLVTFWLPTILYFVHATIQQLSQEFTSDATAMKNITLSALSDIFCGHDDEKVQLKKAI